MSVIDVHVEFKWTYRRHCEARSLDADNGLAITHNFCRSPLLTTSPFCSLCCMSVDEGMRSMSNRGYSKLGPEGAYEAGEWLDEESRGSRFRDERLGKRFRLVLDRL